MDWRLKQNLLGKQMSHKKVDLMEKSGAGRRMGDDIGAGNVGGDFGDVAAYGSVAVDLCKCAVLSTAKAPKMIETKLRPPRLPNNTSETN